MTANMPNEGDRAMTPLGPLMPIDDEELVRKAADMIRRIILEHAQPSAWELLKRLERRLGLKVRWALTEALRLLVDDTSLTRASHQYLRGLLNSDDLGEALQGKAYPGKEVSSSIDDLVRRSAAYRTSEAFQEMISFMANFRDYAPFNNMLVRIQNPACGFYATQKDWRVRFGRWLQEDARPMLILAPMHPVMLVYDLDQTEGPPLPDELRGFAKYEGEWDPTRRERTLENARNHDLIHIEFKELSSTTAGFATVNRGRRDAKMRIAIHDELDVPSSYGVICHELAHIYLGHLGGDRDGWWPARGALHRRAMEVEAEAAAYIATRGAGLSGSSPEYVSRYLDDAKRLQWVSVDQIAKVTGRLPNMAKRRLSTRHLRNHNPDSS